MVQICACVLDIFLRIISLLLSQVELKHFSGVISIKMSRYRVPCNFSYTSMSIFFETIQRFRLWSEDVSDDLDITL